ncbi:MAG: SDR family oxidoreductase [Streptosporangiaceae bacterium]
MPRLNGRVALVAGGAGAVGEGVVRSFLDAGATVVVPSRSEERLRSLRERVGDDKRLMTLVGDVGDPTGAEDVRGRVLEETKRVDAVVASVGGWWQGPRLTGVDMETWRRVLDNNLTTHFVLARTFLPVLRERSGTAYLVIVGDAADHPVDGASLVSVSASGVLGMFRALSAEMADTPVRLNALYLGPLRTRARPDGDPTWLSADEVGAYAAYLASGEGAMVSGSVVPLLSRPPAGEARA